MPRLSVAQISKQTSLSKLAHIVLIHGGKSPLPPAFHTGGSAAGSAEASIHTILQHMTPHCSSKPGLVSGKLQLRPAAREKWSTTNPNKCPGIASLRTAGKLIQNRRTTKNIEHEFARWCPHRCSFLIWVFSSPSNFSFCAGVEASCTFCQISSKTSWPSETDLRTRSISPCSFFAEDIVSVFFCSLFYV